MSMLYRVIIAVIGFLLFMALLPAVLGVLDVGADANVLTIIKVCAAGIALFYILRGGHPSLPS